MIDYQHIADSIVFYNGIGFKRIETPWTVTRAVSDITKPPEAQDFKLLHEDGKVLVGSGEQGFLYLYLKGFLPKGAFQTVTPCFRKDSFDEIHTKYFVKNELIDTDFSLETPEIKLEKMIDSAHRFFRGILGRTIEIKQTGKQSFDLIHDPSQIELGSYGIRECSFLKWAYGTGCAEPRLSYVNQLSFKEH